MAGPQITVLQRFTASHKWDCSKCFSRGLNLPLQQYFQPYYAQQLFIICCWLVFFLTDPEVKELLLYDKLGQNPKAGFKYVIKKGELRQTYSIWSHRALSSEKTVHCEQIYFGLYCHYGGKLHQIIIDFWNNLVPYYLCTWESSVHLLHYFSVSTAYALDIRLSYGTSYYRNNSVSYYLSAGFFF